MAVTQTQVDAILVKAKKDIDALFAAATPTTSNTVTSNLQGAINSAVAGMTLTLAPGFVDAQPIVVNKPLKIIGDSVSRAALSGGLAIPGTGVSLTNAIVSKAQTRDDIVVVTGDATTLQNVDVLGHPALGQKRGITANAKGLTLRWVKVEDIFLSDQDSQAVCGWDNMIGFLAEDCYFSGAGETFLVGGADPADQTRQPSNVTVRRCTLTKKLTWRTPGVQVKTTLELKNVIGFLIEDSVIERAWQQAQDGFLFLLSPRNQDGNAPYSCVHNVTIQRCRGGSASALCQLNGTDDEKPSGRLAGVKILGNTFTDLDPATWKSGPQWGSDKLIQVGMGPSDVLIDGNTLAGSHVGSTVYFYGAPKCVNFSVTNNTLPVSFYGVFGEDSSPGAAWNQFVASGDFTGNVIR